MILSILIPIYNFNILPLIDDLQKQLITSSQASEILVADDKSDFIYQQQTPDLSAYSNVRCLFPEEKLGRAKIRNYLAEKAQGDYLLFLDCDSLIDSNPLFIKNYLDVIVAQKPSIVIGGRTYNSTEKKDHRLHWMYGTKVESLAQKKRQRKPHVSLMTNNLLIKKTIWEICPFDEELISYGHEDTLFGMMLEKKGIPVTHINNPVVHGKLEDNLTFLTKTEVAIANIMLLEQKVDTKLLKKHVKLYRAYLQINKLGLLSLLLLFSKTTKKTIKKWIVKKPNLFLLSIYKLGFFLEIKKES